MTALCVESTFPRTWPIFHLFLVLLFFLHRDCTYFLLIVFLDIFFGFVAVVMGSFISLYLLPDYCLSCISISYPATLLDLSFVVVFQVILMDFPSIDCIIYSSGGRLPGFHPSFATYWLCEAI